MAACWSTPDEPARATPPADWVSLSSREGYVDVTGGKVWYRIYGEGDQTPLVVLHGGPGYPSNYLLPLAGLALDRPVIFYDQLGCGRSDRPDDPSLWTVERFVEELGQVRAELGLEQIHLLGHSWGTMLAVDYLLTKPDGVLSVTLASPALSVPRWVADAERLRSQLPADVQEQLRRHEEAGTTDSAEYRAASDEFYQRFLCRLDPSPDLMAQTEAQAGRAVYLHMWGPSEFFPTGTLRDYDRTPRLGELQMPVLLTAGRFDEATPESTAHFQSLIPGARLHIFEKSAHMAILEETREFLAAVRNFLETVEGE